MFCHKFYKLKKVLKNLTEFGCQPTALHKLKKKSRVGLEESHVMSTQISNLLKV